ncbi:MAG TPA: iron-sulfur cluster assembly scaffold protein [Polyangiaceae bacterium]|nr:iron-sulfur cluster assembly scaffold protein [Polyangiaceae bacterium]
MSDVQKLYQEIILEHHRTPRHARRVPEATHSAVANNPLCGDRVTVTLRVGELGGAPNAAGAALNELGCEVQGCALCRASGSIASELLLGCSVEQAAALVAWFIALVRAPLGAPGTQQSSESAGVPEPAAPEPAGCARTVCRPNTEDARRIAPLLEVRQFASRRRCATLPWEAFGMALRGAGTGTATPPPTAPAPK